MDMPMLDDVGLWVQAFLSPTLLVELAVLAVCVGLAWGLVALLQRGLRQGDPRSILFGVRIVDGALFPLVLLILPLFVLMRQLGLLDTHLALIIANSTIAIPFSVWMMTSYINGIPKSLDEAAMTDGCSRLQAMRKKGLITWERRGAFVVWSLAK